MNKKERANFIRANLMLDNTRQVDVAKALDVDANTVWSWIEGKFNSRRFTQYFGDKFGEKFLKQIEIH